MTKIQKPNDTYPLYVMESYHLQPCAKMLEEQSRGLFGFHSFERCPDCVKTFDGWKFYAPSFGYQASPKTRELLLHSLKRFARDTWKAHEPTWGPNVRHGWRIRKGSPEYWR